MTSRVSSPVQVLERERVVDAGLVKTGTAQSRQQLVSEGHFLAIYTQAAILQTWSLQTKLI